VNGWLGKAKRIQKVVDLPNSERYDERSPTRRADGNTDDHDMEIEGGLFILGFVVKAQGRLKDRTGTTAPAINFFLCAGTALLLPGFALLVCELAGAGSNTELISCLVAGCVSFVLASLVFLDARATRLARLEKQRVATVKRSGRQRIVSLAEGTSRVKRRSPREGSTRRLRKRP
jgi:hypothetical protein